MQTIIKLTKSATAISILIAVLCSLMIIWVRNHGYLQFLELAAYDYYLKLEVNGAEKDAPISLVIVKESDIQRLKQWPIPDGLLAQTLEILLKFQPRAIGLDIYRDIPISPGSEQLIQLFSENHNLIAVMKIGDESNTSVSPPYMIKNMDLVGFSDIPVDEGGIIRRGLILMDDENASYNSFAYLLARFYLKTKGISPEPDPDNPNYLKLGQTTFIPFKSNDGGYVNADAGGYQFLLDFQTRSFEKISLWDLLEGKFDPELIHDRIVIIGTMAESMKDIFFTPLSNLRHLRHNFMYGVEIHAHIASQIIRAALKGERPIAPISESFEWSWMIGWCLLGGFFGLKIRTFSRFFLIGWIGLLVIIVATYLPFKSGGWVPVIPPAISWIMTLSLVTAFLSYREKAERIVLMRLFSSHVSAAVADTIWRQRDDLLQEGRLIPQKLTATVLFTDIEGFTSIAEKLESHELMNWLNEYMEVMARIVIDAGGVVNKYIGDSLMAVFGVPVTRTEPEAISQDAINAVKCALVMERELNILNGKWKIENKAQVNMRVGIHTGPLVAGSIGSAQRLEYTVLGDTVNTASRLESYHENPETFSSDGTCCRILISESTFQLLNGEFMTKKVGEVSMKGKMEKITVFRILGRVG